MKNIDGVMGKEDGCMGSWVDDRSHPSFVSEPGNNSQAGKDAAYVMLFFSDIKKSGGRIWVG